MTQWETGAQISGRADFRYLLAWIKSSERRTGILTSLADTPKNSTEFANRWDVTTEAVTHHLKLLRQGGPDRTYPPLVKMVTPDRDRYRLWGLTEQGKQLVEYLD